MAICVFFNNIFLQIEKEACEDKMATSKCEKRKANGKCDKKGVQKKCQMTCGLCGKNYTFSFIDR